MIYQRKKSLATQESPLPKLNGKKQQQSVQEQFYKTAQKQIHNQSSQEQLFYNSSFKEDFPNLKQQLKTQQKFNSFKKREISALTSTDTFFTTRYSNFNTNTNFTPIAINNQQTTQNSSRSTYNIKQDSNFITQSTQSPLQKIFLKQTQKLGNSKSYQQYNKKDVEDEMKIQRNLLETRNAKQYDLEVPDVTDKRSIRQYYFHYKKLDYIQEQNKEGKIHNTVYTNVLSEIQKYNILPSKLGLIGSIKTENSEDNPDTLFIKNMRYGDNYMNVLGIGMQTVNQIKNFDLSNNRISEQSSSKILRQIANKAIKLDMSYNKIGQSGIDYIQRALSVNGSKLQSLNIEANFLGSAIISRLLDIISENATNSIKILNFSRNNLDDKIIEPLKKCLKKRNIQELYLHWNNLKAASGKGIFEQIKEDENLKVLDLSNNSLGLNSKDSEVGCVKQICEFFENNKDLMHLDLSLNSFNYEQSNQLATSLEKNNTIYGIHFVGNYGYVDDRGFIRPLKSIDDLQGTQIKKRIDGVKVVSKQFIRNQRSKDYNDSCWICEGWSELEFNLEQCEAREVNEHLFVHLNCEDYRATYFGKDVKKIKRMVPPGDNMIFFSNSEEEIFSAPQFDQVVLQNQNQIIKEVQTAESVKDIVLETLNQIVVSQNLNLIQYFEWMQESKPRVKPPTYIAPKKKKKKIRWTYPNSIFAKWQSDDAELINLCHEYDWECGKLPKIIKNQEEILKVKEFFRERYKLIKDTYKNYASFNPVGDVWAIQQLAFQELIDKCKILDGKLSTADINIKWTAVISGIKGQTIFPAFQILDDPEKRKNILNSINNPQVLRVDYKEEETQALKEQYYQNIQQTLSSESEINQNLNQNLLESHRSENLKIESQRSEKYKSNQQSLQQSSKDYEYKYQIVKLPKCEMQFQDDRQKSITITLNHIKNLGRQQVDQQSLQGGKNQRNPERGINRYQLTELLLRIAEEKYINKLQITKSHYEAIKMLWKDHLKLDFSSKNWQAWRESRYWNGDCESVLKYYKRILDHVYKRFSVKKVKPGQQPFMCLDELNVIISQCGLYEEPHFGTQVYLTAFNQSMMTQVDELSQDRIFQMSQIEFYEALARVAEEASLQAYKGLYPDDKVWILDERRKLSLGVKLESLIHRILATCCDLQFKTSYPINEKSIFWVDPNESDFEIVDSK